MYISRTRDVYELLAETIESVEYFYVTAGVCKEGTLGTSYMYSIGVDVEPIGEKTTPFLIFQWVLLPYTLNSIAKKIQNTCNRKYCEYRSQ